ncbi:MAG: cytochrome-c oxidase, cbb3-type subunit III [Pseudomonadota bacterium]
MMSNAWSWFVIVLVAANIIGMVWLLMATSKSNGIDEADTTGHKWDGIEELNNPLPRWWLWLFILTIVYSIAYLYVYPGMGNYAGSFGWTQTNQYEAERAANRVQQDTYFADFVDLDIPALSQNRKAMETAERLYLNNCSTCHGSTAQGAKGFPNLRDDDWLYGKDADSILQSITNGRAGVMPDLGLPAANVAVLAHYLKGLSGGEASDYAMQRGEALFEVCASCHGADGTGNQLLGAPNLTDDIWLHGASVAEIETVLRDGVQGNMPSFDSLLSTNEIRLLSAYVYSFRKD